jgi:hypothetical protein
LPELHAESVFVARKLDAAPSAAVEATAIKSTAALFADDSLIRLARSAESRGLDDFAERAWLAAIRHQRGPLPLSNRFEPLIKNPAAANTPRRPDGRWASIRNLMPPRYAGCGA